jgi:hypothetical protein
MKTRKFKESAFAIIVFILAFSYVAHLTITLTGDAMKTVHLHGSYGNMGLWVEFPKLFASLKANWVQEVLCILGYAAFSAWLAEMWRRISDMLRLRAEKKLTDAVSA